MTNQRYLVSARKHRPQRFSELVAQEHVARTLQNALRLNRLAHAYLFSGPRGVGKTTAARILAKAINCEKGEQEPCRKCTSCLDFESGRSLSIFEIDAASNNKVEDVRELQETVRIPPQGGRRKVYIIDEVHMLSQSAFNALLKTLEEPPAHVLFIFATTQPYKVLATILSRCQRFDFKRIPVRDIVGHLKSICKGEGITADEDSLLLVARKGDGALRDALSAFDQAVALCGTDLKYAELVSALGVVDVELFFEATTHAASRSSAGMLRLVDNLMRGGYDIQEFLGGLSEHLRNLLVVQSLRDAALIDASETIRNRYLEYRNTFSEPMLLRMLMVVEEAQRSINTTAYARLRLELTLLKIAGMHDTLVLTEALDRIDELIALAKDGALPVASGTGATRPSGKDPVGGKRASDTKSHGRYSRSERGVRGGDQERATGGERRSSESPDSTDAAHRSPRQDSRPPPVRADDSRAAAGSDPVRKSHASSRAGTRDAVPQAPAQKITGDEGSLVETSPYTRLWPQIVQKAKQDYIHVGTLLEQTRPLRIRNDTLFIGVPSDLHQRLLGDKNKYLLETLGSFSEAAPKRLAFDVMPELQQGDDRDDRPFDARLRLEERARNEPVVRALVSKLGADIAW